MGKVVSNKMQKSVLVAIERWRELPKYRKTIRRTTKLMAHDEANECNPGDVVRIHSCRPLSKNKSFRVTEILQKAKIFDAKEAAEKAAAQSEAKQQQLSEAAEAAAKSIGLGFAASGLQQRK